MSNSGLKAKIAALRADFLSEAAFEFDFFVEPAWSGPCRVGPFFDSPIEQLVLAALVVEGWRGIDGQEQGYRARSRFEAVGVSPRHILMQSFNTCEPDGWLLGSKITVAGREIRADYALIGETCGESARAIVELDGHDFHERTPDQATRDKSRDRELQLIGWRAFRFTGREVWRDPRIVAKTLRQVGDAIEYREFLKGQK